MMTDPIADLLTRIRNGDQRPQGAASTCRGRGIKERDRARAGRRRASSTTRPSSARAAAQACCASGSRYDAQRRPVITGIQRVSRPSLRVYVGAERDPARPRRPRHQHPLDAARRPGRPRGARAQASAASSSARCGEDERCHASEAARSRFPQRRDGHGRAGRACASKGPKGTLDARPSARSSTLKVEGGTLTVARRDDDARARAACTA